MQSSTAASGNSAVPSAPGSVSLRPDEFDFVANLLKIRSGLALTKDKMYLLENRLLPIARAHALKDISALIATLRVKPNDPIVTEVIEAMTTNESSFFRDGKPFEQLKQIVMPHLRQAAGTRKQLRLWSAACSTGQEPYTVMMTLLEDAASAGWSHEMIATDLANKVVDKAKLGIYTQFEAQRGMPIQLLLKYFKPQPDTSWQISEQLRGMINFKTQNLLENFTALGKFDLIFCRNVLIYFDEPTKAGVIEKMCDILQPGGVLFIGSTESITPSNKRLQQMDGTRGIYKLI